MNLLLSDVGEGVNYHASFSAEEIESMKKILIHGAPLWSSIGEALNSFPFKFLSDEDSLKVMVIIRAMEDAAFSGGIKPDWNGFVRPFKIEKEDRC